MSSEQNEKQSEEKSTTETTEVPTHPEVVELSWEESESTVKLRHSFLETEEYLAKFLLDTERKRDYIMRKMNDLENNLYVTARELRERKGLNPDWQYELKLPESPGEKGYFVRKQD